MARRINLVPQAERTRTSTDFAMLGLVGALIVVVFAAAFGYYLLNGRLDTKKQELADVQQQVAQLEMQVAALDRWAQLATERQEAEAVAQSIYAGRTVVADILDAISLVVVDEVWFEKLSLQTADPATLAEAAAGSTSSSGSGNILRIDGKTHTFESVAQMMVRLQLIPSLSDVTLGSAGDDNVVDEESERPFSIAAEVKNTQPLDTPLPISQTEVLAP